jgi:hypothetical protein
MSATDIIEIPADLIEGYEQLPERWKGPDSIPDTLHCVGLILPADTVAMLWQWHIRRMVRLFSAKWPESGRILPYLGTVDGLETADLSLPDGTPIDAKIVILTLKKVAP